MEFLFGNPVVLAGVIIATSSIIPAIMAYRNRDRTSEVSWLMHPFYLQPRAAFTSIGWTYRNVSSFLLGVGVLIVTVQIFIG